MAEMMVGTRGPLHGDYTFQMSSLYIRTGHIYQILLSGIKELVQLLLYSSPTSGIPFVAIRRCSPVLSELTALEKGAKP